MTGYVVNVVAIVSKLKDGSKRSKCSGEMKL